MKGIEKLIQNFCSHVSRVKLANWVSMGGSVFDAPTVEEDYTSSKWCKLKVNGSAYAFIALIDFETKGLGVVKAGDIFKAATWSSPARHARAKLSVPETWKNAGPYGMK